MSNINTSASNALALRKQLASDVHRPEYHFLPPSNWMNDPNGQIQWKGQYHLFYQHNPYGPFHAKIHWGHAVSSDLVHWTDLPIALRPMLGRADADGCWSGGSVDNHGVPTLIYSGLSPQVVCLATSADDLLTWQYYFGNPVIEGPPTTSLAGMNGHFRDPFVWHEGDFWYMLMGSNIEGVGGTILLYRSPNLIQWDYLHPLLTGDVRIVQPVWTGVMWECPNLLTFGDRRVLLFSVQDATGKLLYSLYTIGTFQDEHFFPDTQEMLVHGGYFYAPQVLHDDQGRYIMWGWLMEGRSMSLMQEAGWAGVMSFPILVALLPNGRLRLEPVPELTALRENHWHYEGIALDQAENVSLDDSRGNCLEILAECEPDQRCEFGFLLRCSSESQEQTRLIYQSESQQVSIEREQSSKTSGVERENCSAKIEIAENEILNFHIFLDHSVLEVFVNNSCYLASRIYPDHPESVGLELFVCRGMVNVKSLDIWHIAAIWNEETDNILRGD